MGKIKKSKESESIIIEDGVKKKIKKTKHLERKERNVSYYPEQPHFKFPEELEDSILKIIASYENSCEYSDLVEQLKFFYVGEIKETQMGVLEYKLSELEEKGIIYWNDDERYEINEGHEPNKRNEQQI